MDGGVLRSLRHVARVRELLLRFHMVPEEGDAERAVCALECLAQAFYIVDVRCDDFSARVCERFCFVGVWIASESAYRKARELVIQDRACESTSLRAGSSNDC